MRLFSLILVSAVANGIGVAEIRVSRVTDATGLAEGLPEYGSLAFVFCTGLRGISGTVEAKAFPLPYELAGIGVRVDGFSAPILVISDIQDRGGQQRITIQMPLARQSRMAPRVTVSQFGDSGQMTLGSSPYWAFFFQAASPSARPGEVAAFHADGSLVAWDNRAKAGEVVVLYGTNLASIRDAANAPSIGFASPTSSLAWLQRSICSSGTCVSYEIWINGKSAATSFFGLAPGKAGIFQVNLPIPPDLPDGYVTIMAVRAICSSHRKGRFAIWIVPSRTKHCDTIFVCGPREHSRSPFRRRC